MRSIFILFSLKVFAAFNLTWGTPAVNLDANPPIGDTDSNAFLAMDQQGHAIATWSRTTGRYASEDIWVAQYNHSLRVWTGAVKVSGGGSSENSQVALDDDGNAIVVWEEGFPTQIKYRVFTKEGVWLPDLSSPPLSISSSTHAQTHTQIQIDSKGSILAVWMEYIDGKEHIFSAVKHLNLPWTPLGLISSGKQNANLTSQKSLSRNHSSGKAIVVWEESNASTSEIHGAIYTNENWTEPFCISNTKGKNAHFPAAGIDLWGNGVVVWSQDNVILSKQVHQLKIPDEALVISHPGYSAIRPTVGVDSSGNAIVVYERYDSIHKFISGASLLKSSNSWTTPIDISAPSPIGAKNAGYPVLSVNEIGDAVVIWKEFTGTNTVIQGAGYSLGTWSKPKMLSSLNIEAGAQVPAYDISVSLNTNGHILAAWPEDSAGAGTLQIKSTAGIGLANKGPTPPLWDSENYVFGGVISGRQETHRFPAHVDLINIISWEAPPEVHRFNIYRNNLSSLIATVSGHRYEDHQRAPNEHVTYLITSLDENGQESSPITVVVSPH